MHPVTGLHHVTAIAGPAQENLDFYAGVLGMRLVKRSVNQDDPGTYHLFYADAEGRPGTDLTFFPWSHLAPSREGHGLSSEVGAGDSRRGACRSGRERLAHYGVTTAPVEQRFGAHVLPLIDPHGLRVALIESEHAAARPFTPWEHSPIPAERQIRGLETARLRERELEPTDGVPYAGARVRAARHRERLAALWGVGRRCPEPTSTCRRHRTTRRGAWGVGSIHHLAWRVDDAAHQLRGQGTDRARRAGGRRRSSIDSGFSRCTSPNPAVCCSSWPPTAPASRSTRIPRTSANRWCCRRGSRDTARRSRRRCPRSTCRRPQKP